MSLIHVVMGLYTIGNTASKLKINNRNSNIILKPNKSIYLMIKHVRGKRMFIAQCTTMIRSKSYSLHKGPPRKHKDETNDCRRHVTVHQN